MHNLFGNEAYEKNKKDIHQRLLQQIDQYEDDDAKQVLKNQLPEEPKIV
ncbi:MAG: hypothetical protein M3R72_07350 [Bacteroidota bacterium]|nr:hypothetical protein [Bacteroidota bacterium]